MIADQNNQLKLSGFVKMLIIYRCLLAVILCLCSMISFASETMVDHKFSFNFSPFPRPHDTRVLIDSYHPTIFQNKSIDRIDTGIIDILQQDGFNVDYLQQPLTDVTLTEQINVLIMIGMKSRRTGAISDEEILKLKRWLIEGGSLLLVVGHYPNGEGAVDLMKALGVEYFNGYANYSGLPGEKQDALCSHFTLSRENHLLSRHPVLDTDSPVTLPVKQVKYLCGGAVFRKQEDVILALPKGTNIYYRNAVTRRLELKDTGGSYAGMIGFQYGKGRVVIAADQGIFRNLIKTFDGKLVYVTINDPETDNAALYVNIMRWLAGLSD